MNTPPVLDCRDDRRRAEVRRQERNGIDYLEVSDDQTRLTVYFLGHAPEGLTVENVRITGGRRIRDIRVVGVEICPQTDPERDNCMVVTVDRPGDFSTYTLCLVDLPENLLFDPRYRCIDFSFKAACPTDLDCAAAPPCPPEPRTEPEISYLAKDYASFRRLILDRLSVIMPEWSERHIPDLGITLVELLAYTGDYLSYYQDAVATEAYLDTARQRISVRRHARLVDYLMHEGCNARAYVHVATSTDLTGDRAIPGDGISFLTGFDPMPEVEGRVLTWDDLREIPTSRYEVFEPVVDEGARLEFRSAHNEIRFYTWGEAECCLPRGATSATLVDGPPSVPGDPDGPDAGPEGEPGPAPNGEAGGPDNAGEEGEGNDGSGDTPQGAGRVLDLKVGDVLIFEEVIGPKTGDPDDADPARRHAVRLTRVEPIVDELYGQPLLEIEWDKEDALPFPLCLSVIGPPPDCALITDVSVARGNVVLVDHGRRRPPEGLGCVPVEAIETVCEREGRPRDVMLRPGRFRPTLSEGPLTFAEPIPAGASATRMVKQDPRQALPWLRLSSRADTRCGTEEGGPPRWWSPRRDLLTSGPGDDHYVVEMDDRGRAHLRFGDGEIGRLPEAGLWFEAVYRVGNGPTGNVGADSIVLAVTRELTSGVVLEPRNPLSATGGTPPEPIAEVKLFAPYAFRQLLERAVTAEDYAELAGRHRGVQRAAATLRWNGSWYEARVAVDPLGRVEADDALLESVEEYLYRFRRIGHDLAVRPADYVPLDVVLQICVEPSYQRGHVKAALLERFGTGRSAGGTPGFFHPDELTFGQGVTLSELVAAAQAIPGVESVSVTRLERLFQGPNGEIEQGYLEIGPLEIARLDSDPSFPENGRIRFDLRGGR